MSRILLDLQVFSSVADSYLKNSEELMRLSGLNIGNYAFRHPLLSLIDGISDFELMGYSRFHEYIESNQPDEVLISCANWLCASEDYEKSNHFRANLFEKIESPVTVFGLGAQGHGAANDLKLGDNTIRMAKILSEKSNSLSIRDEYTQDVLNRYGIHNTTITGCPSNFINLDPDLGKSIANKCIKMLDEDKEWEDIRCHISENSDGHSISKAVCSETILLLKKSPSFYVVQTPSLMGFALGESNEIPGFYLNSLPDNLSLVEYHRVLKRSVLHFSSIESWLDFSRTCDLALGMRIHGNVIPMQAGVPSVVIRHDSRTAGLSEIMGIPNIAPKEFIGMSNAKPAKLIESMIDKYQSYDSTRLFLAEVMHKYLVGNKIAPSRSFELYIS